MHERVRAIRLSEKNFWEKIKDIFASSIDAISQHTAAELISERVSAKKDNLGLTTWHGENITKEDIKIAKNYLTEFELKQLNLLAEQFLSFAELQSLERRAMHMATWISKLIGFIRLNDKPILTDKGHVSSDRAKEIALAQFKRWELMKAKQAEKLKDFLEKNTTEVSFEEIKTETQGISFSDHELSVFDKTIKAIIEVPKPGKE